MFSVLCALHGKLHHWQHSEWRVADFRRVCGSPVHRLCCDWCLGHPIHTVAPVSSTMHSHNLLPRNVPRRLEAGESEVRLSTLQLLQSTLRLFGDKRLLLLVPLMIFSGLSCVYLSCDAV